jgi:hypothetical protein
VPRQDFLKINNDKYSMSLLLNRILLPLLFLAANGDIQPSGPCPQGIEVFHCNFDASSDANFDAWPDGWTRRRGQGYPSYVKIEIRPTPTPAGEQCLQVNLNGGGAVVFSPPVEVGMLYSYVLEASLRANDLKYDRAFLSVTFLDAEKHTLVTFESEKVIHTDGWKKISLGPIAPPSRETQLAIIGLHVEPRGSEDLKGSVAFADIRLGRLPRLELKTNQLYNLFLDPAKVEVTCTASGVVDKNPDIAFQLFDAFGRCLADKTHKLEERTDDKGGEPKSDVPETTDGKVCDTIWEPPIPGPGFYRVQVELRGQGTAVLCRDLTLAVIESRHAPAAGEFGWSLPMGGSPIPLAQLNPLLTQAGINWVKYPLWFAQKNSDAMINHLIEFSEQLYDEGIKLVGLLNDPPEDLCEQLGPVRPISAAEIFGAEAKVWYPSLEHVVSQLAGQVHWWQLGSDSDTSFATTLDLANKLTEIKKQLDRAAGDINLGIGWDCRYALPAETADKKLPLRFMALSSQEPLSIKELEKYLDDCKDSSEKRWLSLQPLAKSSFPVAVRAEDLIKRMLAAKIHGADAIFCPDPFDADCGLMNKDGTPGDMFLPWRTTALELGGASFLGSVQLPHGSQNLIFARANDAVMVVWNNKPVEEVLYFGEEVKQIDIWGRARTPEKHDNAQVIHVDNMPSFISGLIIPIARWYMDLSFAQQRMPSITGRPLANGYRVKNPFPCDAMGTASIVAPRGWIVEPKQISFRLAPGEELQQPILIIFPDNALSGRHMVHVNFEIKADRLYKFSVFRRIEVGLGDVYIEVRTRLNSENKLEVEQRFVNATDQLLNFRCELFAPDRRRLMDQVLDQGSGQNMHIYSLEDGKELLGKTLWLRASEIDGPRILNYRLTVKEELGAKQ